jgi:hypothetical protein
MRTIILLLLSFKCFAQADTLNIADKYTAGGTFTTQWGKEITSNYTLTEADNGYVIHANGTITITVPVFTVPFSCAIIRVGTGKVSFLNATWRAGYTPLSARLQAVNVVSLPNKTAIVL